LSLSNAGLEDVSQEVEDLLHELCGSEKDWLPGDLQTHQFAIS